MDIDASFQRHVPTGFLYVGYLLCEFICSSEYFLIKVYSYCSEFTIFFHFFYFLINWKVSFALIIIPILFTFVALAKSGVVMGSLLSVRKTWGA